MQDSSLNPYIPQESAENHAKTTRLQSPLGRIVKILLILTIVTSILIGAALFFVIPRTSYEDKDARAALGNVLQPSDQISKLVPVSSESGFKLSYENQQFTSYGKVGAASADTTTEEGSGEYYENNELRTVRDYNYVRITPVESADASRSLVTQPPQLVLSSVVSSNDLKAKEAKPEYKELSKLSLFIQLSNEERLAKKTLDDGSIVTIEASKPAGRTINGIQYQKVRYTTKNDNNRIANERYDDCYYTIQNEQPYAACINNIRPNNVAAQAMVEHVLQTVAYEKPLAADEEAVVKSPVSLFSPIRLAQATEKDATSDKDEPEESAPKELSLITKKPEYNENGASLQAVAKNQPSVVRIGTLYCADLALKFESGETGTTLTDACVGNVATGAFVSSDGYIATTGHAIRYNPKEAINGYINFAENTTEMKDRLNRVLDYLLKSKIILQSDADYLKTGAQIGDQEAIAKIENIGSVIPDNYITPVKEEYAYAIQPTDKPIVINRNDANKPAFAYSDSVIAAKFVAANYDTKKTLQEVFGSSTPATDTGLLKAEGEFQNVAIAPGDEVKSKDILNIVGFSAYTDSGLAIDKIRNAPVVTQGSVDQTYTKDNQKVIQFTDAILPGNDGAPVFDQAGKLVGFGVYGLSYCPDQDCFAKGTIRSSNELLSLISKENINFGSLSDASNTWTQGVDEYFKGNYATAKAKFASAGEAYKYNQYAAPASELAASKQGSVSDTSLFNQLLGVMIAILVFLVIATIVLAIIFILHKRRLDSLAVGHYGANDAYAPVAQPAPIMTQPQYGASQAPQQYPPQQSWAPQAQSQNPPAQPAANNPYAPQQPYQPPASQPAQWPTAPQQPQAQPQQPPVDDPYNRQ